MNRWYTHSAHGWHWAGCSWMLVRFTAGPFSRLEAAPAVVDDFGNLVRVAS